MMLDLKMYPLLLTWLQSQNHSLNGMIDANYQKNRTALYHVRQIVRHDWSKPTEQKKNLKSKMLKTKNYTENFLMWCWYITQLDSTEENSSLRCLDIFQPFPALL